MPSLRALLGVAPALIVVAGSFALARHHAQESPRAEALAQQLRGETIAPMTREDKDRVHRVALKQETAEDLLTGHLTLAEAVERFELLSSAPRTLETPRGSLAGQPDRERAVNQVVSFVRVRASMQAAQFEAALARIEAEAAAFTADTPQLH